VEHAVHNARVIEGKISITFGLSVHLACTFGRGEKGGFHFGVINVELCFITRHFYEAFICLQAFKQVRSHTQAIVFLQLCQKPFHLADRGLILQSSVKMT